MKVQTPQLPLKETLRFWAQEIKKSRGTFLIGILAVAGTNLVDVSIPKIIGMNIDALEKERSFYPKLIFALLLIYVLQFICRFTWRRTLAYQSFKSSTQFKSTLWDRARFFPLSIFHKKFTRGELINLATGDIANAQNAFGFHFVTTTDFLFLFTLATICMFLINVKLTLISLVLFPIIPFLVYFICEKESKLYDEAQNSLSKLNDTVDSIVGAAKLMKLRPHAPLWNNQLTKAARNYQDQRSALLKTEAQYFPASALPPAFSVIFFLVFGIKAYKDGILTTGQLVAFHSYLFMIADPLSELGWIVSDWQKSFTSTQRLLAVFAEPKDPIFRAEILSQKTFLPLEISNLKFSYNSQKPLFQIRELHLRPRERLGVCGKVGSGKSTLAKIISGLESHYSGSVKVLGTEIKDFQNSDLRRKVLLVDQNPFLFGSSIRENLSLHQEFSDEEIWHWLEVVDLVDDFRKIPEGLKAHLGEWGINLSGGQRQRLTLARALCRKPELLILDDALSAIDILTEAKIIKNLEKNLKDLSVLLISHRPSSLKLCHRQTYLENYELGENHV
jgi:ATP-binding cassette subfamily B multidrug efflux pump